MKKLMDIWRNGKIPASAAAVSAVLSILLFFFFPYAFALVAMFFFAIAWLWFADAVKDWNDSEENDNPHSRW